MNDVGDRVTTDPGSGAPKADAGAGRQPGQPSQQSTASRRDILIGAGTAAAAAVGAVFAARVLGGTKLPARPSAPASRVAFVSPLSTTRKPSRTDWTALRRRLSTGELSRPGAAGYTDARRVFQPRFDAIEPAAIAYCATPADVAECLSFVRTFKLPVRARSGGHSFAGWSTVRDGLVIDVGAMNFVSFGPQTVTVGAGLDLVHFYASLASMGVAVPAGAGPTVGIAGLALGGGIGALSRLYGTTSDNLTSVDLVTADASLLTCDDTRNSQVTWACRGGGGGNFGVATSLTFATRPLSTLFVFDVAWPWSDAAQVVNEWQSWAPPAPDALSSTLRLSAAFGGASPTISVSGTYAGTRHGLSRHLDLLYQAVGSAPATVAATEESYLAAMLAEAGCTGIALSACHTGPGGRLARVPSFAKSDFFAAPLTRHAIRVLIASIERIRGISGTAGGAGSVTFDAMGGAINRVPAQATAFVHRDAIMLAEYSTTWTSPGTRAGVDNQHAWLHECYRLLHRHASGQAYQNYVDPDLTDWPAAYYGANYPWLKLVKATTDPTNLLQFPQSIPPG